MKFQQPGKERSGFFQAIEGETPGNATGAENLRGASPASDSTLTGSAELPFRVEAS